MRITFYGTSSGRMPVLDYINGLSNSEQAIIFDLLRTIEIFGFHAPGVRFRQIEGKLWEIKIAEHRVFYVVIESEQLVLLHAYKKQSQKLPIKERILALERMKRILW